MWFVARSRWCLWHEDGGQHEGDRRMEAGEQQWAREGDGHAEAGEQRWAREGGRRVEAGEQQ